MPLQNTASEQITTHIPKFGGAIWYVSSLGNDGNTGDMPCNSKSTITAAITAAAAGDAINVKAGTYNENVVLNKVALELWCEIGVLIDPTSGTGVTVSAASCRVNGDIKITPALLATGMLISGDECIVSGVKVIAGAIGIKVTGSGVVLNECAVGFPTSTAYDWQGPQGRLYRCKTVGNAATIGYKISNGADTGVLDSCTSVGHTVAGYSISTGSSEWTLFRCSSGYGDGRWVDTDNANVWSRFSFNDRVYKSLVFDADGPTSANLFRIYGTVLISGLYGAVETNLAGDVGNAYLQLDDGTNQLDLTDSPGPTFNSLPAYTYIHKISNADVQIAIENSSQVRLYEDDTRFGIDPRFQVTAKAGAATYIRLTYSDTGTSGVIHWHCQWEPLSDSGFVAVA